MKLFGIFAALLLVVGAAVALGGDDTRSPGGGPVALGDVRLVSVESCEELVEWFQTTAAETDALAFGGYGMGGDVMMARESMAVAEDSAASVGGGEAVPAAPATTVAASQDESFSGTNVQERDVDEPDTVKTNGDVLVIAASDGLRIVDIGDGEPTLLSTVPFETGGGEIILSGDRVLSLRTEWREDPNASQSVSSGAAEDSSRLMIAPAGQEITVLTSVDISDPSDPQVVETRELPGSYRSARATGTAARIVLVTYPNVPQPAPEVYESNDQAEIERNLEAWEAQAIATMTVEDWSPNAGDCSSVARTTSPQGLGTTTVLTLDLAGSLAELDRDSVVADAGTVYASTDQLVIATSRWSQTSSPEGEVSTEVHAFDITDPATTAYTGSGSVAGYLLNQFSLSEHEGNLRVATTEEAPWDEATGTSQSDSGITVLDGSMQQIGRIDGLGVTERIQAVRYMGDVAYVVTFRQTDPLYAIDLSDPAAPRVAGELKVPGYSAYLHPIDDGRLLGVGQDATDDGQTLGTKVSTFDVSSIQSPAEIDTLRIDNGSSSVEWDHRAFLWWASTRSAVIPVDVYDPAGAQPYTGAVAFDIGEDGSIVERGRVSHQAHVDPNGWWPAIMRSVVADGALYTISEAGVLKSDLTSLTEQGFVAFPQPVYDARPLPIEPGSGGATIEPAPAPDAPATTVPAEG
jgi:hypothetical protein